MRSSSSEYKKTKQEYQSIGEIICPAFNEKVAFNKHGFIHLIRKGRKYRQSDEQKLRLGLLKEVVYLLECKNTYDEYRKSQIGNSTVEFWRLNGHTKDGVGFSVVLRKKNEGKLHFFSVFDE